MEDRNDTDVCAIMTKNDDNANAANFDDKIAHTEHENFVEAPPAKCITSTARV